MDAGALLGTAGIVAGVVGIGWLIDRYVVSIVPRPEELSGEDDDRHAPGTAASEAIACGPRRMRRLLARQRCDCAARPRLVRVGEDEARLGDRALIVVQLRCETCGAARSIYFAPTGARASATRK